MEHPVPYCVYLIRLWPTKRQGVTGCRVSLQSVDSDQREDFPDLESLLTFLQEQAKGKDWVAETAET